MLECEDSLPDLAPALGAVKDDRSIERKRQFQLRFKHLAHLR